MLSRKEEEQLLTLARKAIQEYLKNTPLPSTDTFTDQACVFVSLHKNGQLRGCIGSLIPQPIEKAVIENAIAACSDPRFLPVTKHELKDIDIEISILETPKPLTYEKADELIEKLKNLKSGVIVRHGWHYATFLPQVWKALPDPKDFLSELCKKAGLSPLAWELLPLKISTYKATIIR